MLRKGANKEREREKERQRDNIKEYQKQIGEREDK